MLSLVLIVSFQRLRLLFLSLSIFNNHCSTKSGTLLFFEERMREGDSSVIVSSPSSTSHSAAGWWGLSFSFSSSDSSFSFRTWVILPKDLDIASYLIFQKEQGTKVRPSAEVWLGREASISWSSKGVMEILFPSFRNVSFSLFYFFLAASAETGMMCFSIYSIQCKMEYTKVLKLNT